MVVNRDASQSGMGTRLVLGSLSARAEGGLGFAGTPMGERLMGLPDSTTAAERMWLWWQLEGGIRRKLGEAILSNSF